MNKLAEKASVWRRGRHSPKYEHGAAATLSKLGSPEARRRQEGGGGRLWPPMGQVDGPPQPGRERAEERHWRGPRHAGTGSIDSRAARSTPEHASRTPRTPTRSIGGSMAARWGHGQLPRPKWQARGMGGREGGDGKGGGRGGGGCSWPSCRPGSRPLAALVPLPAPPARTAGSRPSGLLSPEVSAPAGRYEDGREARQKREPPSVGCSGSGGASGPVRAAGRLLADGAIGGRPAGLVFACCTICRRRAERAAEACRPVLSRPPRRSQPATAHLPGGRGKPGRLPCLLSWEPSEPGTGRWHRRARQLPKGPTLSWARFQARRAGGRGPRAGPWVHPARQASTAS